MTRPRRYIRNHVLCREFKNIINKQTDTGGFFSFKCEAGYSAAMPLSRQTAALIYRIAFSISLPQAICIFFLSPPPPPVLSFLAGRISRCKPLCSAAARQGKGLVQAKQVGFREQSRAWFQHLIQFVLLRLKYEMLASQTFKSTRGWGRGWARRERTENLLKFTFL